MKKLLLLLVTFATLFSFTGCVASKPDVTVAKVLDAIKTWDTKTLSEFTDIDTLYADAGIDTANQDAANALIVTMTENLTYAIISSQVNGDTAIVTVDITNTDMSVALADYVASIWSLAPNISAMSDSELTAALIELLKTAIQNNKGTTVTNRVDVTLNKQNGEWNIVMSDELIDAIYGGMITAENNLTY